MKADVLKMDFNVNKVNNTVNVRREFSAPISKVWSAWTESKLLDMWWAPKPWKSVTKTMNFTEGGYRIYAMVGPDGEKVWARADFNSITPKTNFKFLDAFCDEAGNINNDFPRSDWNVDFVEFNDSTTIVNILIKHDTMADLEKIIEMGFKEGFTMALENLDEVLKTL